MPRRGQRTFRPACPRTDILVGRNFLPDLMPANRLPRRSDGDIINERRCFGVTWAGVSERVWSADNHATRRSIFRHPPRYCVHSDTSAAEPQKMLLTDKVAVHQCISATLLARSGRFFVQLQPSDVVWSDRSQDTRSTSHPYYGHCLHRMVLSITIFF